MNEKESFYQKCGTYSYKTIPQELRNEEKPKLQYELQRYNGSEWLQIPLKSDYEKVLFEAHGPLHVGAHACEMAIGQRYWFPH